MNRGFNDRIPTNNKLVGRNIYLDQLQIKPLLLYMYPLLQALPMYPLPYYASQTHAWPNPLIMSQMMPWVLSFPPALGASRPPEQ